MKNSLLCGTLLALAGLTLVPGNSGAQQAFGHPGPLEDAAREPGQHEVMQALEAFRARHGDGWRVRYEPRTQAARFLYGGSAAGSFVPRSDADHVALAREFLAETWPLHRVDAASLVEERVVFLPLAAAGSSDKTTVRFEQRVRGVPVAGGSVNVLFDTQGRLLSIDSQALPVLAGFPTDPSVSEAEARAAAAQLFRQDTGLAPTLLQRGELEIAMSEVGKHLSPRLVWQVNAQWFESGSDPLGWRYLLDAHTGAVVRREASVHFDVSGVVQSLATPGNDPDDGSNAAAHDMPYMTVTSSQGSAVTDVDGNFTIQGASAPLQVTVQYEGTYAATNDTSGGDYSLSTTLSSSSGNTVLMNSGAGEADTAEANAFRWIGLMREWTRTVNPADSTSDFLAPANVMLNSTCNAYYDGVSVNFYAAGGGCVNSAFSSVVIHEMGHWMNDLYGSGNGSDGFGEGNADVFALYILEDPIVGKDFFGPGTSIRDANNSNTYCGSGCYGQVHADGEVLMGALWNVRENLQSTHGFGAGGVAANTLFNAWMNAYDDGTITPLIEEHWLTLDDDNGDINDGTPNYADIDGGFVDQGFPGYPLSFVVYSNVVEPPDTQNQVGPYTVSADIAALFTPPVVNPTLHYSVNDGPFVPVAMGLVSGNTYTGDIPGQTSPAKVEWYLEAADGSAQTTTYPLGAPAVVRKFEIGQKVQFFFEDFEGGTAGWTHGQIATQDDWQRSADVGAPNGSYGKAGDPTSAYSGTQIWGNDLGQSGWNGFYADDVDNWLRSPSIDLTGAVGARLRFQRWLTIEQGIYDQARVLVDGTEVWINDGGSDTVDTAWVEVEVDISAWDGDPDVRLEFTLTSDASVNFGGWNLDDVEILTLTGSCPAPTASDPSSATICAGQTAAFSTVASGAPPLTYQWRKDGSAIPGATSPSYSVVNAGAGDAGDYSCAVTDACTTVVTAAAQLTVDPTTTASDPADATRCPGTGVTFSTAAGGTGPFAYQWKRDGTPIGGATASSYTLPSVSAADEGSYTCEVSGACGTVETAAGILTVDDPVTASDPLGQTVCAGGSAGFSTTAGGTGPLSYQWQKDGVPLGGATSSALTLNPVSAGDAGDYTVLVTGACGTVETAAATLVVPTPVTASSPADATECPGAAVTFSTTAGGSGPFTYQWKKDGASLGGATSSSYSIASVSAGDAGTYSVLVTGACGSTEPSATLIVNTPVSASDPAGATVCEGASATFSTSASGTGPFGYQWKKDGAAIGGASSSSFTLNPVTSADAGAYTVAVTGACGTVETAAATLVVDTAVTATPLADETVCEGAGVSFSTTAGGSGPFSYQWKKDGTPIGGATASSYTLPSASAGDAGTYSVAVTGACGSTEPSATLTVDAPVTATDPAGATVCEGLGASFATTAGGSGPFSYQWKKDGVALGGASSSSYSIGAVSVADAGDYTCAVTGACGTVETAAATLVVDTAVTATPLADATVCEGAGASFSTTAGGSGPFSYQWKKDGAAIGGATSSSYTIAAVTAGDAGTYSVAVTGACGSTEPGAVLTVDQPVSASDPAGVTVCEGGNATFATTALGTGPFGYQWQKDGFDISGATASSYSIGVVALADAGDYTCEVTGACGTVETAAATLVVDTAVTATPLADETVCEGAGVSFSTTAGGSGPFSYQWKKDGAAIGGATSSSYTIAATTVADAGAYSVLVTGACGTVEPGATLVVNQGLAASDPADALVCLGAGASFSTVATGSGPLGYQWKLDGVPIGGASGSSYSIAAATAGDAGDYTCEVTGACGLIETAAATLTVGGVVEGYCTAGTSASGCQALLSATGTPSASASSGFVLGATGVEGAKDGLFFFGTNGRQANPWGSGSSLQCVVPPVLRGGLLPGSGTPGACDGQITQDLNALWCAGCPKPAKNPGAGAVVQAQLWYRDPQNTSNQTTSLSDAVEFTLCP